MNKGACSGESGKHCWGQSKACSWDPQAVTCWKGGQWHLASGRLVRQHAELLDGGGLMGALSSEVVPKGLIIWAIYDPQLGLRFSLVVQPGCLLWTQRCGHLRLK